MQFAGGQMIDLDLWNHLLVSRPHIGNLHGIQARALSRVVRVGTKVTGVVELLAAQEVRGERAALWGDAEREVADGEVS